MFRFEKMKSVIVVMLALLLASCASAPPVLPSPANVRKSMPELSRQDKERALRPSPNDLEAIVLLADHELLACGGTQVGEMYQAVLDKKPYHIRANLGMGEWYVRNRKYKESLSHFRKVLDRADKDSPEYAQAEGVLKYAQYKLNKR